MNVTATDASVSPRNSLVKSFFETRGQKASVSARVYLNKLVYGLIRQTRKTPDRGWLESPWHWYRFPFSMRDAVLWSPFLKAWFAPEDESAMECMMRLPSYEPVDWVAPGRDDVFLDVGGYIGPYSLLAAGAVGPGGKIIAMEPDPANRRQLQRNLALNEIENCTVIPCAAWSKPGRIGWREGKEPVWHGVDATRTEAMVDARAIDDVVAEFSPGRLDWIKMDIEGGEVEALKGAEKTLSKLRPAVFIEVHETMAPLRDLLASMNYSIEREQFDEPPEHHGWILARPR